MIFGKFQETEKEYNVDSFNSKFKTLYYLDVVVTMSYNKHIQRSD